MELALFLPVYLGILVGVTDYGFLLAEKIQVQEAAAAGAAYGTIPGNYKDLNGMQAAAKAASTQLSSSIVATATNVYSCSSGGAGVGSTATCPGGGGALMFAQVDTSYPATLVLKYAGFPATLTLHGFASYEVPWAP